MIEILGMGFLDNFRIEVPLSFYTPLIYNGVAFWIYR